MGLRSEEKILKIIDTKGSVAARSLVTALGITPQAVHRHLRRLVAAGRVRKVGGPPRTRYEPAGSDRGEPSASAAVPLWLEPLGKILAEHPAVRLATLFGSQARGDAGPESDIDVLVWLGDKEPFTRQDLWRYWDRHSLGLPWKDRVSLIVRRLKSPVAVDTLLLDLPEEHRLLVDRKDYFPRLRTCILKWREKNGAVRVESFGGTHGWRYTSRPEARLDDIDFTLELGDVS